jgi:hypothetical protein
MNDPWPLLIAALSGQRINTPASWPVRTVHRLESYACAVRAARQTHRSLQHEAQAPLQMAR